MQGCSKLVIRCQTFYAIQKCMEMLLYQLLRIGSYRKTTNLFIGCYKFVVIPNSYTISKIGMRMPYVLRKTKMQEETIIREFGIRDDAF